MAVAGTTNQVWTALAAIGAWTERALTSVRWRILMIVGPAAVLLLGLWLRGGAEPTITFALILATGLAVVLLYRNHPQVAGVLASIATSTALFAAAVTVAVSSTNAVPLFAGYIPIMLTVVTAAVFVAPHRGVHTGWSVALAQASVLGALPAHLITPDSTWSSLSTMVSLMAAFIIVYFRARKALRGPRRRWRTALRGAALGLIICLSALTASIAAVPGDAHALFGIGDFIESKTNDLICSFTRPDLTPEPIGTGTESVIPARNLGQVKASTADGAATNAIPQNTDQAANYDRLGQNYSLDNYTLYEIAGLRGLKYVNWQKNDSGEEVCSIMPWISVVTGNIVMKFNLYTLQLGIFLKEFSQAERPFEFLYDKTLPFVDGMFTYFFIPMGGVIMMVVAIFMAVRALGSGNGFRSAVGDVGGVFFVLVLGGLLFGGLSGASWVNPNSNGWFLLASTMDETTTAANSGIAEFIFDTFSWDQEAMMCTKPVPVAPLPNVSKGYNAAVPGQRYSSCVLAEALAYRPWAIAQFGSAGNHAIPVVTKVTRFGDPRPGAATNHVAAKDDKAGQGLPCYNNYSGCDDLRTYLIAQEGGPTFAAARKACMGDDGDYTHLVQCDPYHAVANELTEQTKSRDSAAANRASEMLAAYHGQGSFPHLTQSLVAFVGTVVTFIGVGVVSLICLWWQMMLFVLFLTGVFRLTVAGMPGKSRMAVEYIADVAGTFIYRFAYGLLCMVMIVMVLTVFTMPINMGLKILFLILFLLLTFKAVGKVQEAAKVKGSTMNGPGSDMQKVAVGAGIAGYLTARHVVPAAAKGGWKAGSATTKGVRNAAIGAPAAKSPAGGVAGGNGGPGGSVAAPGQQSAVGGGGATRRTVGGRPIGGVAGAAAAVGSRVAPRVEKGARNVGSGVAAATRPLSRFAGNVGRDAVLQGRQAGRRADRAVGGLLARPASRIPEGRAVSTMSGYARAASSWVADGIDRAGDEAKGVVSWMTPRYLGESMSPETRKTLDANVSASSLAGWMDGMVARKPGAPGRSTFDGHAAATERRQRARDIGRARRAQTYNRRFNQT